MERPNPKSIPTTPGVYLYKDSSGFIIYVGKARNLRKRVLSYFREQVSLTPKTKALMNRACCLETITTSTEKEALLFESSLIKKHKPKYNIVLRDDKQYVLFRIQRNTPYPRLEIVRKVHKDNARYFGPFTSSIAARETWKTIHQVFPLRRCSDRAFKNRVRPCLYFYIKQCLAPCTGQVSQEEYSLLVDQVKLFLSGRSQELIRVLRVEMDRAVEVLAFEKAATIRDQIQSIKKTIEKQHVVIPDGGDMDVIGVTAAVNGLGVGFLFVREGKLIDSKTFLFSGLELEDIPELLISFLGQIYSSATYIPPKIILPKVLEEVPSEDSYAYQLKMVEDILAELREGPISIGIAKNTYESKLMDLALINAQESIKSLPEESLPAKLANIFHVDKPITRIECIDVSHTGGENTRIGMVVFEEGQPLKKEYRLYSSRDDGRPISGGDDYAALASWIERRLKAGAPWADLVLIDGGRGQVHAVQRVLDEKNMSGLFILAGIAKARNSFGRPDRRAGNLDDVIFLSGRVNPLPLRSGSPELLFLQRVRDTAHSFVNKGHRKARGKAMLSEGLQEITGIGKATSQLLWKHFRNIDAIVNATPEELQKLPGIGTTKANTLSKRLQMLGNQLKKI